jgi:CIC family chloride channel protein
MAATVIATATVSRAKAKTDKPPISLLALSLAAVVVGLVTGFGAILFRALISYIHNVFFLGKFSFAYDANVFTPASPWGPFVILVPVLGGLVVVFLVTNFAPEARGHGVPEVMDAVYYKNGIIRPVVAAVKSLASAFSIGTGAAVGREGPIIQIGSTIGSTLGQIVSMAPWQRITLVAAGAGAGIASTFNTPLGGVMFAIEIMMPEVSVRTFLPVALATGTATFIGRLFFGIQPAFIVPIPSDLMARPASATELILSLVLGAIVGVAATAFIRGLHWSEEFFERIKNPYVRHIIGMTLVGAAFYALHEGFGHYYIEGVGYSTIQAILSGGMTALGLMALLMVCKLAATSVSLGSGSSGGIFSPSLYMGATLGGAFGALVNMFDKLPGIGIPGFAMVGMAAMVGGGTGAAMTAIVMIFEMTRDYDIVVPMILAVAVAIGVRRMLSRENIYTIKLVGRRHFIPKALHANMFLVRQARDVMDNDVLVLSTQASFDELRREKLTGKLIHIVVAENDRIKGVQRINLALRNGGIDPSARLGDIAHRSFTIAREDDIVFDIIERMSRHDAAMAVIVRGKRRIPRASDVVGVITKEHIADSVAESVRTYPKGT